MPKKRFNHLYIEITNICQFNCSFCPKTKREAQSMTISQFEHILIETKAYCDTLYLHVLGEPLIHADLDLILELAALHNFKINITTNGFAIKEKASILLKYQNIKKINISLHSIEDENHLSQSIDEYLNNILDFTNTLLTYNTTTIIYRLWNTNKNYDTVMNFLKCHFEEIDFKHQVTTPNGIRLKYRLFLSQENEFEWPINANSQSDGYCLGLKSHLAILVNGDVVPCCLDSEGQIKLGNIFKQSFEEILNSERLIKIKEGFQAHRAIEPLCQKCSYKKRFTK